MFAVAACQSGSSSGDGVDPGIIEVPIAFVKRPIALDETGVPLQVDLRDPTVFISGGDVYLRSNTAVGASLRNITKSVTGGIGDVKGLNASYDGGKLVFSLRLFDEDPDDEVVPSWNLYEYDIASRQLRPVIADFLTAEAGDDLFPAYLPDGRIVFTSNRQTTAGEILINEGKPSYRALIEQEDTLAMVLHVVNADGSDLRQISFHHGLDLYPQVLTRSFPGKIVFSRWDKAVEDKAIHYYMMNPDGSELELLYGLNSHFTGFEGSEIQFGMSREMENGDLMLITRPYSGTYDGGNIEIIDIQRFVDNDQPIWSLNGLAGPAQRPATIVPVTNDGSLSLAGRYNAAFPLWDGSQRILVSKASCQLRIGEELHPCIEPFLSDPAAVEAPPVYAIWLYDPVDLTEKPIVLAEAGNFMSEVMTVQDREAPPIYFEDKVGLDPDQVEAKVGVVNIKSVYDLGDESFDGCYFGYCTTATNINTPQDFADPLNATADQRPARFVRFIKPVGFPAEDDPTLADPPRPNSNAFSLRREWGMREIVGYAPVEPDGSVKVRVPANIPLGLEILDGEGRRIGPMHYNWFQVAPGATLTCNGCHLHDDDPATPHVTHARLDATAPSVNKGLSSSLQFVRTRIPGSMTPYWGSLGETMAEVRFGRFGDVMPPVVEPQLSADLVYEDYWTDPTARLPDASYAYRYADLDTAMAKPSNNFCVPWEFNCRSVINYPEHIHAIWQLDRGDDLTTPEAPANPPNNDPTNTPLVTMDVLNGVGDDTCIECHTTLGGTRLPYGQLDLTTDPNQNLNQRYLSFRQMFFSRAGRMFDGMTLVPITRMVPDGMGGFIEQVDPAARVRPIMSVEGARAGYFMEKMTGTELDYDRRSVSGSLDHSNMLSGAELKLIAEWLDLGAQNFNDPFDPAMPQN